MTVGSSMRIAIVGAGIGGLTLALALRQRGIDAQLYEQAPRLTEIGAAVALSANATRELRRLGVLDAVMAASTEPSELIFRSWQDGRRVAAHDVHRDGAYQARFGAPYCGIHRADLQRALAASLGDAGLHLGHRLATLAEQPGGMALTFDDGVTIETDLVVGADGLRSVVRGFVTGGTPMRYSGTSAFRGIVPANRLPSLPDPMAIQFWMGPGAHLLHYPIGGAGQDINYFAVVEGPEAFPPGRSTLPIRPGEALAPFTGWHPAVTEMIAAADHPLRWGLFTVPQPRRWHRAGAVLLGDAVHAMVPHHGQGANTTIEDAITLAELLTREGPASTTLQAYQSLRQVRTRTIQTSAWATNHQLHLQDHDDLPARDARMAAFPARFGWIHAFDSLETARARRDTSPNTRPAPAACEVSCASSRC